MIRNKNRNISSLLRLKQTLNVCSPYLTADFDRSKSENKMVNNFYKV